MKDSYFEKEVKKIKYIKIHCLSNSWGDSTQIVNMQAYLNPTQGILDFYKHISKGLTCENAALPMNGLIKNRIIHSNIRSETESLLSWNIYNYVASKLNAIIILNDRNEALNKLENKLYERMSELYKIGTELEHFQSSIYTPIENEIIEHRKRSRRWLIIGVVLYFITIAQTLIDVLYPDFFNHFFTGIRNLIGI